jgi:hypothetical protein
VNPPCVPECWCGTTVDVQHEFSLRLKDSCTVVELLRSLCGDGDALCQILDFGVWISLFSGWSLVTCVGICPMCAINAKGGPRWDTIG